MNGILILDKPKKYTSHDVVNIARKALDTRRIGHIGTLDPNATGVLVLCVNRSTKLVKYFQEHKKTYEATIILGIKTDTDDLTGKITARTDSMLQLKEEEIKEALLSFLGKQKQIPPNYSAIKVNGQKLYDLARRDVFISDLSPRDVEVFRIDDIEIIKTDLEVEVKCTLEVSTGTYIRSIARDLGEKLNTFGTLKDLRRTSIDGFDIKDATTIEDLKNGVYKMLNPFDFLDMQKITVDDLNKQYIENGRFLDKELFPELKETIIYSSTGEVLAIYFYDKQKDVMRVSVKWR